MENTMRATTRPILIQSDVVDTAMEKLSLGKLGYDEAWLQALIAKHPEVLPVAEIEPAFEALTPAGREIACGHGYIDNLYLTSEGHIVVVETKLHANSQARREVVAQALDYVAALTSMSYTQFEAAVCAAQHAGPKPSSLYELVKDQPEALDECAFIDTVANNLRRGRMMVLVVGDGIRSEAESLAGVLQGHAGAHFTFALIELAIYRTCKGDLLVVPSTLAKTLMIERAVVRIEQTSGQIVVEAIDNGQQALSKPTPRGLTEIEFDETMNARKPGLAENIHNFIQSLSPLGVYAVMKNTALHLKAMTSEGDELNLGYIWKNGQLWTELVGKHAPPETAEFYLNALAQLTHGQVGTSKGDDPSRYVQIKGTTSAPRIEAFLPHHANAWRDAIARLLHELRMENTSH
jgi:hypothetical protein